MPLGTEVQAAKPATKPDEKAAATDPAPEKIDIQPKEENAPEAVKEKEAAKEQEAAKPAVPEQILPAPVKPEADGGLQLNGATPEASDDTKASGDKGI